MGSSHSNHSSLRTQPRATSPPPAYAPANFPVNIPACTAATEAERVSQHITPSTSPHTQTSQNASAKTTLIPLIQASSIPQWRWTNLQCREWIIAVLIEYYNKDQQEAIRLASEYMSFGPGLWQLTGKAWQTWLGPEGVAMHDLMLGMYKRREPGSVPEGLFYLHFEPKGGFLHRSQIVPK